MKRLYALFSLALILNSSQAQLDFGHLTIDDIKKISTRIVDDSKAGRIIWENENLSSNGAMELTFENITSGQYLIVLTNDNNIYNSKILVEQ